MMKSWMKALMIFKFQLKPIYNIFPCTRSSNRRFTPISALHLNQDRHFLQCAATPERAPFAPPGQISVPHCSLSLLPCWHWTSTPCHLPSASRRGCTPPCHHLLPPYRPPNLSQLLLRGPLPRNKPPALDDPTNRHNSHGEAH